MNPSEPDAPKDGFEPRANDHLVEPMFAGLGVEGGDEDPAPIEEPKVGLLGRLRRVLFGRR